jgi:hypothetical protein
MPKIESTLSSSHFEIPANSKRYVVDDVIPESHIPQERQVDPFEVQRMRRQAAERASHQESSALFEAQKRVEIITGIGQKTKNVTIEDSGKKITFTLRSLKAYEQNEVMLIIQNAKTIMGPNGPKFHPEDFYKMKVFTLSYAISLIDGSNIDLILGTADATHKEKIHQRRILIEDMDDALITHLYGEYQQLQKEVYDGYMPTTAEQAKEVVESINKSGENA